MKKITLTLFSALAALLVLSACQKKDDGGGTYATTPVQPCNVPGNSNCNPGAYQEIGPQTQNYQWSYSNGFCGCGQGYRPIMNQQWGISCAPAGWFPGSAYYSYSYNQVAYYQSQNAGQWMAIPQVTYNPVVSGNTTNCHANAASVCDIRQANSCSNGGVCRPSAGGSYLGFCTHGSGNESYSHRVCNYEYDYYQGYVYRCRDNYHGGSQNTQQPR